MFGALAGVICYGAIQLIKFRLHIDDSLDVFAVHGVGGMLGTLLLAFFLSPSLGGVGYAEGMSMGSQLAAQAFSIAIVATYSAIASVILALMASFLFPMRVSKDEETEGLDITSHGERGWEMD
jgi:Amt family ammonium transporter